jgi:predicted transcriptional regulator
MGNRKHIPECVETSLWLDGRLARLVDLEARRLRVSRSAVVRLAVAEYAKARQLGLPPATAGGFIIPWESMETMGGRKRYEVQMTVELPRELRELVEREALRFQISRSAVIRQALLLYFAARGLLALAPQPSATPPGAGYEGAEGQRGLIRPDEGRPIIISKEAGGGGG